MPLTDEQEQREHELRVEQMAVNIEKMRRDMRNETIKIVVSIVAALVAAFAAGHFIK